MCMVGGKVSIAKKADYVLGLEYGEPTLQIHAGGRVFHYKRQDGEMCSFVTDREFVAVLASINGAEL